MDDPNSALPSDPSVDESYTKSSRPARPRARSGAQTPTNVTRGRTALPSRAAPPVRAQSIPRLARPRPRPLTLPRLVA